MLRGVFRPLQRRLSDRRLRLGVGRAIWMAWAMVKAAETVEQRAEAYRRVKLWAALAKPGLAELLIASGAVS